MPDTEEYDVDSIIDEVSNLEEIAEYLDEFDE